MVVAPFFVLFVWTALARCNVPFELEWNEGHSAEQALRFAHGRAMYPAPEDGWVPYMYAPLYHMALGAVFRATGQYHLFWGRFLSLMATLATATAILMAVQERTRRPAAACLAALLFFAFYKPTGFWFDIARNDAMAFALAMWGMVLTLKARPRPWEIWTGLALLALSTFAKQTMGPVAVFCGIWVALRRGPHGLAAALVTSVVAVNAAVALQRAGNPWLFHYTIGNAARHLSDWRAAMPGGVWPEDFAGGLDRPGSAWAWLAAWVPAALADPPMLWRLLGRHLALPGLLVAVWVAAEGRRWWREGGRRRGARGNGSITAIESESESEGTLRGLLYLVPFGLMLWGAVGSYVKYGGYVNNFLPVFGMTCVLVGMAAAGLWGAWPQRGVAVSIGVTMVLLLMIVQPGGAGEKGWPGLLYAPRDQVPREEDRVAHNALSRWLRERAEANEAVWVMHHQWHGVLAGHPLAYNIDMVRTATYAGDGVPRRLREIVASGVYEWLVLDRHPLEAEWWPVGLEPIVRNHYEYRGLVPGLEEFSEQAMRPVTGAPMAPRHAWHWRAVEYEDEATTASLEPVHFFVPD